MCRYGFHNYKRHCACFDCRKTFKRDPLTAGAHDPAPCPDCGRPMADLGLDFKAPRRSAVEPWAVAEHLFRLGFTHHGCGCGGQYQGRSPDCWSDVPAFLTANTEQAPGERLLARFAAKSKRTDSCQS